MWESDHKEGWVPKNWHFQTVVLEKIFESPLDSMEIKPVNPKWSKPWIFIGRIDTEAEAPILWPPEVKSQLNGKDPDAGNDWGQEKKGTTEDDMVGWHHWLDGLGDCRAGKPGVQQSMGLKRVGHKLAAEKQLLLMGIFSNYIYWYTNGHGIWSLILAFPLIGNQGLKRLGDVSVSTYMWWQIPAQDH